jgi:hypothetical protein
MILKGSYEWSCFYADWRFLYWANWFQLVFANLSTSQI